MSGLRRRLRRAVLLLQGGLDAERQFAAVLPYAEERRSAVISVTGSPTAALALVRDHLAEVVIVCFSSRSSDELADAVRDVGGELEAVRRSARPWTVDERNARMARQAIERGATPEMAALVLGMTVGQVCDALGEVCTDGADLPHRERRVERVPRPQDRHPEPVDDDEHPWRVDNRAAFNRPYDGTPHARVRRIDTQRADRGAERRPRPVRSA